MADTSLSLDKLRALYADFDLAAIEGWQEWLDTALLDVQWAQEASVDELSEGEGQRRLWSLRGISTLGASENLSVDNIVDDVELVTLLVSLRDRQWPLQAAKRGQDLQSVYAQLLDRVGTLVEGNRPKARLLRAMFALLPHELHVGFTFESNRHIRNLVINQPQAKSIQAAVQVRERLRQALGSEESLDEAIRRSMFCWWLFENSVSLLETGQPKPDADKIPTATEESEDPNVSPLVLLPFGKQYKGVFVISGMVSGVSDVVQACLGGRKLDELVELLRSEEYGYSQWSPKTTRAVIARLLGLGLLAREEDVYRPSDDGDRFLEDEPAVFVELLFVRVYGFAQTHRVIADRPISVKDVAESLRGEYPKWTSDWMARDLLRWGEALGLSQRDDKQCYLLTDYGRSWIARLPERLPKPPPGSFDSLSELPISSDVLVALPTPSFAKIWAAFQESPHNQLIFSRSQVRALHAAWSFHSRKRFAILSGLSGTGKTELLLTYSHVICQLMSLESERHVRRVAVGPDWRDPTGLLGYFNALHAEPTFQAEPALRIVLDAVANPDVPFFLVLDEMNLARVERYFAPFLSAMESDKDPHIQLHAHEDSINGVPPSVPWPKNLRIGGTVNMDETTHPFSDKVLDRAFTLEFWEVDLDTFFAARPGRTLEDREGEKVLLAMQKVLRPIRRHFGYRSAGEVLDWVRSARESDGEALLDECLDQALFSKILTRLRGAQSPQLEEALRKLAKLCEEHRLPLCEAKVVAMEQRLRATGVTGFWS